MVLLNRALAMIAVLCLLAGPAAFAQVPKATLGSQISQTFPDNATGAITPSNVRTFLSSVVNSFQQYTGVNAQVGTTYTILLSDYGQLITVTNASPVAVTIPQAASTFVPFNFYMTNLGAGTITLTPSVGTIDGAANFTLAQNQGVQVVSDGTNWQVLRGFATGIIGNLTLTMPSIFAVSGSPCITTTCTFGVTLQTQAANTIWAGPASAGPTAPTFRAMVRADLPTPFSSLASGVSGGVACFTSTTAMASSVLQTANAIMLGGGAGVCPSPLGSLGTTTTLLHGNAAGAPSFGAVVFADISDVASLAQYLAGTASKLVNSGTIYTAEVVTTFGTTTTFDFSTFINTAVTLTGNITTQTLSNVQAGKAGTIAFIQDGTGSRTSVWNSVFKFSGGVTPTLTTTAAAVDILTYSCRSATFCVASLIKDVR